MKKINKTAVKGKKVIVRLDLDVPIQNSKVVDSTRLKAAKQTLDICKDASQIIIIGHAGRPKGVDEKYSLLPVAKELAKILKVSISLVANVWSKDIPDTKYVMLENLRYEPGEKKNSAKFAKHLSSLGDVYVNDAFAVSHRKAASNVAITKYLPSYAGSHLYSEVKILEKYLKSPKHPFILISAGAKLDKLEILGPLMNKANAVLTGGLLSLSLLQAQGHSVGAHDFDTKIAKKILKHENVVLPVDGVLDTKRLVDMDNIPNNRHVYDLGPKTIKLYKGFIKEAKLIVWNGPLGYFEKKPFDNSTNKIALAVKKNEGISIIGGGDTVASLKSKTGITHVTTAGGAFLTLVSGKKLVALEALN